MAERQGEVTDITMPAQGKVSGSCKVGGRKVWFFWNAYESEEPSEIRQFLEDAQRNGLRVKVSGEERSGRMADGKEYKTFSAKDVRLISQDSQNGQNGSQGSSEAPRHFVGRDPGMADFFTATRWTWSLASEMLKSSGKEVSVSAISQLAGEIFQASYSAALANKEWADGLEKTEAP